MHMTGFRRVATCKCCGVDKCGGSFPLGCTSTISSCPSTYAVTFGVSSHTVKVNCGTLASPDCQDYIEYPATTFPAVTVTQNATNKCIYEGVEVDVSGVSDSWTTNPCSGGASYTYNWDELLINVTSGCANLLGDGQLCPCVDADGDDYCSPSICAGFCAEIFLKTSVSTGRSTSYVTRNFSACFFSHCIGSCTDLVPCYNSYGSPDTTRSDVSLCPDTTPMDICSPCISDGSNGWKGDCSIPNYRADSDWGFTASIS